MVGSENIPARSSRHSRDDVANAALRILDEYGLPDLTMRRLAAALNVQPSALYWHFPDKQTLLAELADRIVARRSVNSSGPGADWTEQVADEAVGLRDALLAFRDGAEVVSSSFALGIGSPSLLLGRLTDAISGGGFDPITTRRAATAMLHFVLGHVSHEQQRMQYDSLVERADGTAPALLDEHDEQRAAFSFGVALLIAGLRSRTAVG